VFIFKKSSSLSYILIYAFYLYLKVVKYWLIKIDSEPSKKIELTLNNAVSHNDLSAEKYICVDIIELMDINMVNLTFNKI